MRFKLHIPGYKAYIETRYKAYFLVSQLINEYINVQPLMTEHTLRARLKLR